MYRILHLATLSTLIVLTAGAGVASGTEVFFTDFDAGVPAEFDRPSATASVQGYDGLGVGENTFGGEFLRDHEVHGTVTLTLGALPAHDTLDLHFLLAIIDSWDGGGAAPGSDFLTVRVDGATVFSEAFENSGFSPATYSPPPGVLLFSGGDLAFTSGGFFYDAAYDMSQEPAFLGIPHTSSTVTIQWVTEGVGYQGGPDESWAMDNVRVTVNGAVPIDSATWGRVKGTFASGSNQP